MGQFDPATFLDINITEANSTESTPVPEGEYLAVVEKVEVRQWQQKDGPKSGLALDLAWKIDSPNPKEFTGRDENFVKQGLMLDLNAGGGLDTGKGMNVGLGRLRTATGLNVSGQPFSFRMLTGKIAKVSVKHRVEGDQRFADVKAVAPA